MLANNNTVYLVKAVFMAFLFLWISFIAPLFAGVWVHRFIGLLFALLVFLQWMDPKTYKLIFDRQSLFLGLFLLLMIPGIIHVEDSERAYSQFQYFILPIPVLYFFAKATYQQKHMVGVLRAICFMAAVVSIIGIIEFMVAKNFIYEQFVESFAYQPFIGKRAMSLHVHPAPLGTYLLCVFPLSIGLVLKEQKGWQRGLAFFYLIVISECFILTFSRGALFGVFVEIIILIFFLVERGRRLRLILWAVALPLVVLLLSALFDFCYSLDSFGRFSLQGLSTYFYSNKLVRIFSLGAILKDHPFFGLGLGHYLVFFDHYVPGFGEGFDPIGKVADCLYITILAENGIVGFSAFMLLIISSFKSTWEKLRVSRSSENYLYGVCFLAVLGGLLINFLTYETIYWVAPSYLFWSCLGILAGFSKSVQVSMAPPEH